MARLQIRQSGGANIVSIPKVILKTLNLKVGSALDLNLIDGKIVLTPTNQELTLKELLAESPQEKLNLSQADREWLDESPVGNEW